VRDLLATLRPAGGPGAATPAGVPKDRRQDAAAELRPVFEALAPVLAQCREIRAGGRDRAQRHSDEAGEQARLLLAEARRQYDTDRAAEAARLRDLAEVSARRVTAEAEADADRVRRQSAARRPEVVAEVVSAVRAELDALR
jgi:hypothetical protein